MTSQPYALSRIPTNTSSNHDVLPTPQPTTCPQRLSKDPSYLSQYHCYLATNTQPPISTTSYSIFYFLSYENSSPPFTQASTSSIWHDAMGTKFHALQENNTWPIVSLSPGKKSSVANGCTKPNFLWMVLLSAHKACLVAKEYTQQEGIYFLDIFSFCETPKF